MIDYILVAHTTVLILDTIHQILGISKMKDAFIFAKIVKIMLSVLLLIFNWVHITYAVFLVALIIFDGFIVVNSFVKIITSIIDEKEMSKDDI